MIAEIDYFLVYDEMLSDGADWTSTGRLFQSRGPAAANERSPTVTSRDGRTSRRLEVDDRPESHLGSHSRLDLAPKRLESRLSHHLT